MEDLTPPSGDDAEQKPTPAERRKRGPRPRAVPLLPEVRFFAPTQVEVRSADENESQITITGAAIVYGAAYRVVDMFGEFRETIHAGSASDLIDRGVDCRLLLNHGSGDGLPMARTVSGTMDLVDDPDALRFIARLDPRQGVARDFAIAVERGDLNQMSVGMVVGNDDWRMDGGMETRDIYALSDLLDISGVTYPCSPTTHIEVAKRMAFAMPLESRARLRRMEVELRAGKVLSADSQSKLVTALGALHDLAQAGGVDPTDLGSDADSDGEDGSEGRPSGESDAGLVYPDGSGQRDADAEGVEHRDEPTDEDWGIANCLANLKMAIAGAKAMQLADPDNDQDPDDAAVMAAINEADSAIDRAITAQSKDGHSDAPDGDTEQRVTADALADDHTGTAPMKASTLRLVVEAGRS